MRDPEGPPTKRRILIVDGHPLVRRGLTALIEEEPDLSVCAAAANRWTGLEATASFGPDLVIADLALADGEGLPLVRDIRSRHADLPVLVLSMHGAWREARSAFEAGATGYLSKRELDGTLVEAIRALLGGETYASPEIRAALHRV